MNHPVVDLVPPSAYRHLRITLPLMMAAPLPQMDVAIGVVSTIRDLAAKVQRPGSASGHARTLRLFYRPYAFGGAFFAPWI